jgi:hypothetical protein
MKLLTKAIEKKLIANIGKEDIKPVVKFFGGGACTWLFTEYNPETDAFFGLCDLGMGSPELGYVSRTELESIRFKPFNLPVERDMYWEADKTITEYAEEAGRERRIVS